MNAEAWLVSHLSERLGVPAYAEVPGDRPERFVTVERTGGSSEPFRDLPTVAVQCWAQTRYEASEMARRSRDACLDYMDEPGVSRVEVTSMYDFPDPDSRQPRYQLVVELVTA